MRSPIIIRSASSPPPLERAASLGRQTIYIYYATNLLHIIHTRASGGRGVSFSIHPLDRRGFFSRGICIFGMPMHMKKGWSEEGRMREPRSRALVLTPNAPGSQYTSSAGQTPIEQVAVLYTPASLSLSFFLAVCVPLAYLCGCA